MRQHYPLNSQGAEDAGTLPWTDGVPSTGTEGSYFGHALFTDSEAEILAAIDAAGLVRNGSDLTQLVQAIARGGLWLGQFAGTATALTATLPNAITIPTLQAGMRVRGIAASNYTGSGGTLAITGIGGAANTASYPLIGADGVTALSSGAWKAGQFLTFEIDASGNARFGGAGGALGERTYLYKAANQALAQAATEYDIAWDAPAASPSWGTLDPTGTFFTVTQKCSVLSFAAAVVGVSCSAAGYAEADLDLYLNGPDYENTGQSAWPSSNTTYLPYLRLATLLDLNVNDVLKVRVSASAANFNSAAVIGNASGSYGVKGKSTAWKLLCVSKG